jgi:outer membrane receptor protein involved in Fe transport
VPQPEHRVVSFGRAFPRFYIRGLGNTDFDLNASQPVSMVVDEVVQENPILKGIPLFDLERIEVLRGPQGTLFGRNTPAGVVKFETVKPSAERDGYVRASYGTYDSSTCQGAVGGPSHDTCRRASRASTSRSDWVDNKFTGPDADASAATRPAPPAAAAAVGAQRQLQRPAQPPRLGPRRHGAHLPRQHHRAGHQRPRRRLRPGRGLPRRPQRAGHQRLRRRAR